MPLIDAVNSVCVDIQPQDVRDAVLREEVDRVMTAFETQMHISNKPGPSRWPEKVMLLHRLILRCSNVYHLPGHPKTTIVRSVSGRCDGHISLASLEMQPRRAGFRSAMVMRSLSLDDLRV